MTIFMQKTFTFQHTAVAYEDIGPAVGKGRHTVLLIHGFGEDGTVWKHQAALLQNHYRLIIPDLPGSGLSPLLRVPLTSVDATGAAPLPEATPPPGETTGPSLETFAELLYALLRHEKIEKCCMIGHSMGGYITLAFAERHPGFLSGWGLFHSTAFEDNTEKKQARRKGIAFIQHNGAQAFLKLSAPNLFTDSFKQAMPEEVAALIQRGSQFSEAALIQYYEAMLRRPDRRDVLRSSLVPVLLMIGKQDAAVPLKESLQLTSLAPMTFVYILEQAAHMGMWEAPLETGSALLEYLRFTMSAS
jgi:pimeloyl-ACP methyl ester carboxylesterase